MSSYKALMSAYLRQAIQLWKSMRPPHINLYGIVPLVGMVSVATLFSKVWIMKGNAGLHLPNVPEGKI